MPWSRSGGDPPPPRPYTLLSHILIWRSKSWFEDSQTRYAHGVRDQKGERTLGSGTIDYYEPKNMHGLRKNVSVTSWLYQLPINQSNVCSMFCTSAYQGTISLIIHATWVINLVCAGIAAVYVIGSAMMVMRHLTGWTSKSLTWLVTVRSTRYFRNVHCELELNCGTSLIFPLPRSNKITTVKFNSSVLC